MTAYQSEASRWNAFQFKDPFAADKFIVCYKSLHKCCRPNCDLGLNDSSKIYKDEILFMDIDLIHRAIDQGFQPCEFCLPNYSSTHKDGLSNGSSPTFVEIDLELLHKTVENVNKEIGFINPSSTTNDIKLWKQRKNSITGDDENLSVMNDESEVNLSKNEYDHVELVDIACRHIALAALSSSAYAMPNSFDGSTDTNHQLKKKRRRRGGVLGFKELATKVKLSPWHFHRIFKNMTNLTSKAYGDKCWDYIVKNEKPITKQPSIIINSKIADPSVYTDYEIVNVENSSSNSASANVSNSNSNSASQSSDLSSPPARTSRAKSVTQSIHTRRASLKKQQNFNQSKMINQEEQSTANNLLKVERSQNNEAISNSPITSTSPNSGFLFSPSLDANLDQSIAKSISSTSSFMDYDNNNSNVYASTTSTVTNGKDLDYWGYNGNKGELNFNWSFDQSARNQQQQQPQSQSQEQLQQPSVQPSQQYSPLQYRQPTSESFQMQQFMEQQYQLYQQFGQIQNQSLVRPAPVPQQPVASAYDSVYDNLPQSLSSNSNATVTDNSNFDNKSSNPLLFTTTTASTRHIATLQNLKSNSESDNELAHPSNLLIEDFEDSVSLNDSTPSLPSNDYSSYFDYDNKCSITTNDTGITTDELFNISESQSPRRTSSPLSINFKSSLSYGNSHNGFDFGGFGSGLHDLNNITFADQLL